MATVTVNIALPSFRVSAKMHQRIVSAAALLGAAGVAITQFGPGFGLPASYGAYASEGVIVASTILRALFPLTDMVPAGATAPSA